MRTAAAARLDARARCLLFRGGLSNDALARTHARALVQGSIRARLYVALNWCVRTCACEVLCPSLVPF